MTPVLSRYLTMRMTPSEVEALQLEQYRLLCQIRDNF